METRMIWPPRFYSVYDIDDFFDSVTNKFNDSDETKVSENDGVLTLTFDLPGFEAKDVSLDVEGNKLYISASNQRRNTKKTYVLRYDIDVDSATAEMKCGVLTITFPSKSKMRRIEVK